MSDTLNISPEITAAINHNQAVVALESSVIAHGLPKPVNAETALAMEDAVRSAGAVPATIGVIEGAAKVGLTREEIERLAEGTAAKLGARDLPYAIAKKIDGGTTVSGTIRVAASAGIGVMATGGIGGVHRDFAESMDISADLWELARTPVVVVCSGIKAVLDIRATSEWLESHSVPIYGYGTDELPAFYSRKSGISVPKLEGCGELAEMLKVAGGAFGMRSAIIIAVPIPQESELDVSGEVESAAREAVENGIRGKDLTPYLLKRVGELTGGRSIAANVALLKNNAAVAAEIACALTEATSPRRIGFLP